MDHSLKEAPSGDKKKQAKDNRNLIANDNNLNKKGLVLNWNDWLKKEVPPREFLISPIIPQKGLVEIYSERGVGKTFLGLAIALAAATGTDLLRWSVSRPRRVLYVDGEMAFPDLQERIKLLVASMSEQPKDEYLRLLAADLQERGIPDLSGPIPSGRKMIDDALHLGKPDQADLLILDNLSTLTSTGSENSDESWNNIQRWLLRLRHHGVSVLFMHHAGKGGKQRGTSKREDALDTVIALRKPRNYKDADGARFEISYEKHRGFFGGDATPFEAQLLGNGRWKERPLAKEAKMQLVANEIRKGKTVRQVASDTGISKSSVERLKKEGSRPQSAMQPNLGQQQRRSVSHK